MSGDIARLAGDAIGCAQETRAIEDEGLTFDQLCSAADERGISWGEMWRSLAS